MSYMGVLGEGDYYNRQSSGLRVAGVTAHPTKTTAVHGCHQIALHAGIAASPLLGERAQCEFSRYKDRFTPLVHQN